MNTKIDLNLREPSILTVGSNRGKLFAEFIFEYLQRSKKSDTYKRMYYVMANHVLDFSQKNKLPIYTDSLSEQVLEEFVFFLQDDKQLMMSTIKSIIERTKSMLQKAYNAGFKVNGTFKDFTLRSEEIDTIFLPMTDITRIYYYTDLTPKQVEIKDYFIIGCLTGLRYSDYSRLKPENFVDNRIEIRTKKTKTPVEIPMHKFVREIIRKYNYELPPSRCIQYFNKAIKNICRKIGFVELIPYERHIGTEYISEMRPKWTFISSHTARRSAATNMFLVGIPTFRIMLLTGHKSESAFFRYIRITREENATTLSDHQFFN